MTDSREDLHAMLDDIEKHSAKLSAFEHRLFAAIKARRSADAALTEIELATIADIWERVT